MFEYIACIKTRMGLMLIRAGFENMAHCELWLADRFNKTSHAGLWEIWRNGELVHHGRDY